MSLLLGINIYNSVENFYNGCRKIDGPREPIRRLKRQRNQEEPIEEAPSAY